MKKITETCTGQLSIETPDKRRAFLIDKINKVIKPPRPASDSNVDIRAMYILNDLVNSHGGRFDREELGKICGLLNDTPVLLGHNRSEAPIARTFHAELESKGDVLWVKSYFYRPRQAADDRILEKIDAGILKECSISFVYTMPQCSVCGEDMRKCGHDPRRSENNGDKTHFLYKGIQEVLETSLVYKGSVKGTFVTDRLSLNDVTVIRLNYGGRCRYVEIPRTRLSSKPTIVSFLGDSSGEVPLITVQDNAVKSLIAKKGGKLFLLAVAK